MSFEIVTAELLECFQINLNLFFVTLLFGLPLGLIISFGSMSKFKPLSYITNTFVWIIRGTPLMLQIIIIFYGPGLMFDAKSFGRFEAAAVAFVINYACYFSEIYRGGIESVPKGQYEAGQVLGLTKTQIFFRITLLQMIKRILAPMGNEFMTLIKDTSLARIISNKEIIMMAGEYTTSGIIWPLFYTGAFFLISCGILTLLFNFLEKKLKFFN
ncbi:MAG: amino acid ABC transporter permease [Clostridia bacterium]